MVDERDKFEAAIDAAVSAGRFPGPELLVQADWLDEQNTAEDALLAESNRAVVEWYTRPKTPEQLAAEELVVVTIMELMRRGK